MPPLRPPRSHPARLPSCSNPDLKPLGAGTQRIEAALRRQFPQARIARIDRDTKSAGATPGPRSTARCARASWISWSARKCWPKGHDFPSLSRVVALNADGGLYSADFRAEERLFALLTQVAGRAGRGALPARCGCRRSFPITRCIWPCVRTRCGRLCPAPAGRTRQRRLSACGVSGAVARRSRQSWTPPWHFARGAPICRVSWRCAQPGPGASQHGAAGRAQARAQLLLQAERRAPLHAALSALRARTGRLGAAVWLALRWSLDVDPQEL